EVRRTRNPPADSVRMGGFRVRCFAPSRNDRGEASRYDDPPAGLLRPDIRHPRPRRPTRPPLLDESRQSPPPAAAPPAPLPPPAVARRCFMSAVASTRTASALSQATIGAGVPAGANRPNQLTTS